MCRDVPSVREFITFPNAERDLFIFLASSRVWPVAPVLPTFSEPARSTRNNCPERTEPVSMFFWEIVRTNILCDRDDSAFMSAKLKELLVGLLVDATTLAAPPRRITSYTSGIEATYTSSRSLTYTPL